ncbi:MAG TPA: dienelactone hydrolase family protein [Acidimicrobiia bacterium]|jgi:carboxymethylenebutenolidase
MAVSTRYERVSAHDSGEFDAFCATPGSGQGPGVVLFQEIFGINDNMRGLAERLAGQGFVTLVPDMFWRLEPRFERKDESGLGDAFALVQAFDWETGGADMASTFAHLLAMPECTGRVGGVGFCFGGTLAYLFAATGRVDGRGPDAAVSYYGSGVHTLLNLMEQIECPVMFHYGSRDPFIPEEQIAAVEAAAAGRVDVALHRYDAGHAFSNWDAPSMYDKESADLAWDRTLGFLATYLGRRAPQ